MPIITSAVPYTLQQAQLKRAACDLHSGALTGIKQNNINIIWLLVYTTVYICLHSFKKKTTDKTYFQMLICVQ